GRVGRGGGAAAVGRRVGARDRAIPARPARGRRRGLDRPVQGSAAAADETGVARLTMTQAVALLAASPATVTDESGRDLELDPVKAEGTRLVARIDRLRTGEAGALTARVHGDDLRPWSLGLEIEQTEYHNVELATVTLRAKSLRLDDRHRKADRTS